jgi:outer membrane usher protein
VPLKAGPQPVPRFAGALLCCLGAAPLAAWPADDGAIEVAQAMLAAQAETMVVRVSVNTEDKGDIFIARTPDRDFLVKVEDLKAMGFRQPAGRIVLLEGEPHVFLRSMHGVSFEFQERGLALKITAEPRLLPSQSFEGQGQRKGRGAIPTGASAFFNYALTATGSDAGTPRTQTLAAETGARLGDFLLLSDGTTIQASGGQRKFVRLMSSVTHDDRADLRRTVVGDFFTPSRDFSAGVNLGGIGISKLYGLDPYFIRFPMQSVSGNVALPSDLEVYMDGQRIRTERLKPGEFELRDILAYGGARNVQLVLRDAFGRVQQLNYSFYFSDQPLRGGLHEYSYNLGALRRNYGTASSDYGPAAFTLFHRYGFSDALTLGLRAEGMRGFVNAGPLATLVLGDAGIVNFALAASQTEGLRGMATNLGYNYQAKNWSFGFSLRHDSRDYAGLGDPPMASNRRYEGSVNASYNWPGLGSLSLSHAHLLARGGITASPASATQPFNVSLLDNRRVTSLNVSAPLVSGRASLTASLSHIKEKDASRNEAFVGVTYFLDKDYSAAANYRNDGQTNSESIQLTRNQPIGEGLGFVLSADRASDHSQQSVQAKSSVQYNAPAAVLRAEYGRHRDGGVTVNDYRASVAGGIAMAGGEIAVGRPVTDSFAIVKVGELEGVAVSVNGQPIGKTDARGKVFVPTLTPYFDNNVSISTESISLDYTVTASSKKVSPSLRGGAVVDFAVVKLQAVSGKLKALQGGTVRPVEFQDIRVNANGAMLTLPTGRGGEFYVENLKAGNYDASVPVEGRLCVFLLAIPQSDETFVELGDLMCRPNP